MSKNGPDQCDARLVKRDLELIFGYDWNDLNGPQSSELAPNIYCCTEIDHLTLF